ncbi:MAG: general secretion pathway protein GspK [Sphingomonadales bacterium]
MRHAHIPPHSQGEAGVALVVVLWLLAAMSLAAAIFATSMRTETTVASNEVANAKARALADAGAHRGIFALFVEDPEQRWLADGRVYTMAFGGGEIDIMIESETGKIDLNTASEELLKGLLQTLDLEAADVDAIGDAIIDWRDDDDLKSLNGAETQAYQEQNLPYKAKNAPFDSIDELQQVLGITGKIHGKMAPAITIYSGRGTIDPSVAPRQALLALPGVNQSEVEDLLEARRQIQYNEPPERLPPLNGVGEWLNLGKGTVFTVRARARLPGGASFVREAVAWLPPDEDRFWILDWRAGAPALPAGEEDPE